MSVPALVGLKEKDQTGSQVTSFQVNVNVSQGNTLIVVLAVSTTGITFSIDSATGTYTQDAYRVGGGVDLSMAIWSSGNLPAGSHTLTIGCSALEFVRYAISEWSGIADSNRVITSSVNSGTALAITSGNVTTPTANTLLFGAVRTDGDETAHGDLGAGTNFTLVYPFANAEPEQKMLCEYRVVDAGTYGNGFTQQQQDGGGVGSRTGCVCSVR